MPDPTPPPQGEPVPPTGSNEGDKPESFSVTKEDWESSKRERNALAAELRLLKKSIPAPPPAKDDEEPQTQKAQIAALQKQLMLREDEVRRGGIRSAIQAAQVHPDAVKSLQTIIEARHAKQIKTQDGVFLIADGETGEERELTEYIVDYLKTPEGKFYAPPKTPGPNTRGGRGGSAPIPGQKSVLEMTNDELLKMPRDQYLAAMKRAAQG